MMGTREGPIKRLLNFLGGIGVKPSSTKDEKLTSSLWQLLLIAPLFVIPFLYLFRYRLSVKKRLKQFEEPTEVMVRVSNPKDGLATFRVLELTPEFLEKAQKTNWTIMSLGSYLSTLRPSVLPDGFNAPQFVQREMERFMAATLLNYLGPRFGAAILPVLGFSDIQSTTGKMAVAIANWFASQFIVDTSNKLTDPGFDKGAIPFSLFELSAFANLNQTVREANMSTSPIQLLKQGEVAYSPSFGDDNDLIPNPFIVEVHWEKAMTGIETRIQLSNCQSSPPVSGAEQSNHALSEEFDPEDRSLPPPTPINQRLFPDLHIGWGSAKCTHTKREIVRNRLFAVLLNRLAYNYYNKEQGIDEEFAVKFAGIHINTPHSFIWALLETGHEIEVCPRSAITTFGIGACVKEKDGSWTNIPLSYFFRTGYENESARPAHVGVPHGGMDLTISGPLVGKKSKCNIQFYMAIEGMCGWHSNHNVDVPWIIATASTEPYSKEKALQAVRMASLLSVTFNAIGTEQKLPFGGYGVLGVCNDTAALLDQAIRGTTNMYPLVSTGRYLMHIAKRLVALRIGLLNASKLEEELKDIQQMIAAIMDISSDLQASPSNALDATRRYLACLPRASVFQLEAESKEIMTRISSTFDRLRESSPEVENTWNWKRPMTTMRHLTPPSKGSPLSGTS